ncbi:hypothetical protein SAMN05421734_103281 [Pelagirhabdus alkalitolerans]|uniref:YceG-like family protein n=1 Tax=Pelagirhabdus alkalitolerans TaxID=1612202 RepID=A0A1G6HXS0_9BACI|nr:hypothetical protein [Pelagirhabdus alkalitolerans]SDB99117.1 hypothetical protein SAMN05421734_103281 [Pelagirhabdus alkalitolerans]
MKHYLRAFALGLITATLIILVYHYQFEDITHEVEQEELTDLEMINRLEAEGYFISQDEPTLDEVEPESYTEDNEDENEDESDDENNVSEADSDLENDEQNEADNDQFILTIEEGMTVSQVADYLIVASIIDSREEFTDFLSEHDYGTNIQVGQFELSRDMSLEEVVDTIASQN